MEAMSDAAVRGGVAGDMRRARSATVLGAANDGLGNLAPSSRALKDQHSPGARRLKPAPNRKSKNCACGMSAVRAATEKSKKLGQG